MTSTFIVFFVNCLMTLSIEKNVRDSQLLCFQRTYQLIRVLDPRFGVIKSSKSCTRLTGPGANRDRDNLLLGGVCDVELVELLLRAGNDQF